MENLSPQTIEVMFKNIDEKLDLVHEQTKQTNARVSRLESFKSFVKGALSIISIIVVPIFLYMVYNLSGK